MSNAMEQLAPTKDVTVQTDNTSSHLHQALFGRSNDWVNTANKPNDSAQSAVENHFGKPVLVDDTAAKPVNDIAKDWDKAAKTGDFSAANKELQTAVSEAFKDKGPAGVVELQNKLNDMVKTPGAGPLIEMNGHDVTIHNARNLSPSEQASSEQMNKQQKDAAGIKYDKEFGDYKEVGPSTSFKLDKSAAEPHDTSMHVTKPAADAAPAAHAERQAAKPQDGGQHINDFHYEGEPTANPTTQRKGNEIAQELKSGASDSKVAADLQDALKNGANLDELVKSVNKNTALGGIGAPHLVLRTNENGTPDLTLKHGMFGGTQLVVTGGDVKVGATYR